MFYCAQSAVEGTHLLDMVVLGRWLLVEEDILGQLLLKVHGVDGRLRERAQQWIRHEGPIFYGKCIYSNISSLLSGPISQSHEIICIDIL